MVRVIRRDCHRALLGACRGDLRLSRSDRQRQAPAKRAEADGQPCSAGEEELQEGGLLPQNAPRPATSTRNLTTVRWRKINLIPPAASITRTIANASLACRCRHALVGLAWPQPTSTSSQKPKRISTCFIEGRGASYIQAARS